MSFSYKMKPYRGKDGQWYIRTKSRNGKIVMDAGEGYSSKSNAIRACLRFLKGFVTGKVKIDVK